MILSDLPSDLLGELLYGRARSYLLLQLWKCGDSALNSKLASGVTYLRLLRQNPAVCAPFPSVIFSLRSLQYLSVTSAAPMVSNRLDWSTVRSRLPKSLETLKIVTPEARYIFLNFGRHSCLPPAPWDKLQRACVETQYALGKSRFIDIESLLPNLQSLKLCRSNAVWSRTTIDARDLPGLPTKLTRLSTSCIDATRECRRVIGLLPKSLTSLRCTITINGHTSNMPKDDWKDAPPNLLHLNGGVFATYRNGKNDFEMLPKTLISCAPLPYHDKWDVALIRSLPPLLESINMPGEIEWSSAEHWADALPRNLTSIYFSPPSDTPLCDIVPLLPRCLTRLQARYGEDAFTLDCDEALLGKPRGVLEEAERNRLSANISWPPALKELYLSGVELTHIDVNLHPHTLTSVSLEVQIPESTHVQVLTIPPHLTSFTIQNYSEFTFFPLRLYILSHCLRTLNLLDYYIQGARMQRSEFELLPSTLTSLSVALELKGTEDETPWALLPTLRELTITPWPVRWFANIPKSVKSLSLKNIPGIQDASGDIFKDLPPTLEDLAVRELDEAPEEGYHLADESFSTLSHLSLLEMSYCYHFTSGVLRSLPADSLRDLDINIAEICVDDAAFIPPRLTRCIMPIQMITPAIIDNWPGASLQTLAGRGYLGEVARRISDSRCTFTTDKDDQDENGGKDDHDEEEEAK